MHRLALVMVVLVACGDGGSAGVDASHADGAGSGSGSGSGSGAPTAKAHTLFLQLEGVTVKPGADDATMDSSGIVAHTATLKPWRMGDAARATQITALTTEITGILAPYNITVVTTRPASGTYHEMIVSDDDSTAVGFPTGFPAIMAVSGGGTCNTEASPVSFVFPGTTYNQAMLDAITRNAIAMFAFQDGVPQSTKVGDCMCFSASGCSTSGTCTIGGAGTPVYGMFGCGQTGTMDEGMVFRAAFGAH